MQIPESGKNDFFIEILYFTGSSTKFDRPERIPEKYRRSPAKKARNGIDQYLPGCSHSKMAEREGTPVTFLNIT